MKITTAIFYETQSAQIDGTVKDATGAIISAGSVTATNVEIQVSRTVQTNETGTYVLANLQPGSYLVTIAPGRFSKGRASDLVALNVNQIATLNRSWFAAA